VKIVAATGALAVALAFTDAQACGNERWAVKTLTDPAARDVHFKPRPDSIARLVTLTPPAQLGARTKAEKVTVSMRVRLIATKLEPDGDIHLIVGEPSNPGTTMIVEFPDLGCTRGAQHRWAMELAKRRLLAAAGPVGDKYRSLSGTATVSGVIFFDFLHGQGALHRTASNCIRCCGSGRARDPGGDSRLVTIGRGEEARPPESVPSHP
jgi:hypothetical protein